MQRIVLVIDDDHDIREVAKTSLELVGGFRAIVAESGQRGVTIAHETRPDAIILDLMMPREEAVRIFHCLRERNPHLPVLLCTGLLSSEAAANNGIATFPNRR